MRASRKVDLDDALDCVGGLFMITNGNLDTSEVDDRPDWDDYWMQIANAVSLRSTDPGGKRVGAVIVRENVLISTGYNGFARGVQHSELRGPQVSKLEKLRWMCHAEQNAIFNAARLGVSVAGAKIYTTKFPCLLCMNAIVQSGIQVVFTVDSKPYDDEFVADDGGRVFSVLAESGVKLEAPSLGVQLRVEHPSVQAAPSSAADIANPNLRQST